MSAPAPALDHLILRVRDAAVSARFYAQVLGFCHEGRTAPFEIVRVAESLTLDLLQEPPHDPVHLAFALDRAAFEAVRGRLREHGLAFGGGPFERDGTSGYSAGARGRAEALYFYDPDGHNIEVRTYAAAPGN